MLFRSEKEKGTTSKRKKTSLSLFAIPYVTLITHYAKSVEILQPKYEMVQIAVVYNLASIAKMGYNDLDNNENFVKIRGDKGEEDEPAQAPEAHTFGQVMDVLAEIQISVGHLNSRLDRMDEHIDIFGCAFTASLKTLC